MTIKSDGDVKNVWFIVLETLAKQGLSFLLLGVAIWYFNEQNNKLETRVFDCNSRIVQVYEEQNDRLLELVENNNRALQQNSEAIHNLSRLIRK